MKPQCQAVLKFLKRHRRITPLQADRQLGIGRLGARIWDLKREGYEFDTALVAKRTRYGTARVAEYRLA